MIGYEDVRAATYEGVAGMPALVTPLDAHYKVVSTYHAWRGTVVVVLWSRVGGHRLAQVERPHTGEMADFKDQHITVALEFARRKGM
jgi:hypothetical protein